MVVTRAVAEYLKDMGVGTTFDNLGHFQVKFKQKYNGDRAYTVIN